jgi:hypothetical protein
MNANFNISSDIGDRQAELEQSRLGINTKKAFALNLDPGFSWVEPSSSLISVINPTKNNYHPLLEFTNHEIASNLFSIEGAKKLTDEQKEYYKKRVEDIVKNSYYVKERGRLYKSTIVLVIFIIIIIILLLYSKGQSIGFLKLIVIGVPILAFINIVYILLISYNEARGRGVREWDEFSKDLGSKINSGQMTHVILKEYENNQNMESLKKKYENYGMINNITTSSTPNTSVSNSFVNGLFQSMGNNFGNKINSSLFNNKNP